MRFHSGEELFDTAEFFETQSLPLGYRMGIVSNSQGVAALAVDACGSRGLAVGRSLVIGSRAGPRITRQACGTSSPSRRSTP